MSWMSRREANALDRYITGNYGEDHMDELSRDPGHAPERLDPGLGRVVWDTGGARLCHSMQDPRTGRYVDRLVFAVNDLIVYAEDIASKVMELEDRLAALEQFAGPWTTAESFPQLPGVPPPPPDPGERVGGP